MTVAFFNFNLTRWYRYLVRLLNFLSLKSLVYNYSMHFLFFKCLLQLFAFFKSSFCSFMSLSRKEYSVSKVWQLHLKSSNRCRILTYQCLVVGNSTRWEFAVDSGLLAWSLVMSWVPESTFRKYVFVESWWDRKKLCSVGPVIDSKRYKY